MSPNDSKQFLEFVGVSREAAKPETPLQFFQLFFIDEIFEQITEQTNKYYEFMMDNSGKTLKPFANVTVPEMKAYHCYGNSKTSDV